MGIYSKKVYKKDRRSVWNLVSEGVEKIPHNRDFWLKNQDVERSSNLGERTYLVFQSSTRGDNQIVSFATTYFGTNEKVERKLLTTSNSIPKKIKWG